MTAVSSSFGGRCVRVEFADPHLIDGILNNGTRQGRVGADRRLQLGLIFR